ncbi:MAG: 50S ribosomal protein L30 [Fidelibacterota bacterium]|jgi:large subunit ribosomal protein L30|tara:strand:+ start:251 stop:436 length:186 start_codon:yes stop_codon:yes gene_type:complete
MVKKLKITQIKSSIGYKQKAKLTLKALGLRKMHQTVEHLDSPSMRGMLNKINYLVKIEESS